MKKSTIKALVKGIAEEVIKAMPVYNFNEPMRLVKHAYAYEKTKEGEKRYRLDLMGDFGLHLPDGATPCCDADDLSMNISCEGQSEYIRLPQEEADTVFGQIYDALQKTANSRYYKSSIVELLNQE